MSFLPLGAIVPLHPSVTALGALFGKCKAKIKHSQEIKE
jgi:hypothetical protein